MHIDRFSSLDELKGKDRRNQWAILAALKKAGKFSCFEVDDRLAGPLTAVLRSNWVTTRNTYPDGGDAYPWTFVSITPEGEAALSARTHFPIGVRKADKS
jgi:hypothetical protein